MIFIGEGKANFADESGVFFSARFIGGLYETEDPEEIKLLKNAGYKTKKLEAKKPIEKEVNDGSELHGA